MLASIFVTTCFWEVTKGSLLLRVYNFSEGKQMPRAALNLLFGCTVACMGALVSPGALAQSAPAPSAPVSSTAASAKLPSFDAATIKPPDPKAHGLHAGFSGDPGGRVFFGGWVKMLVEDAFNLQDYQVSGGPGWLSSQWFEINAVPPPNSPSLKIKVSNALPTAEQGLMLQSLLAERFAFKYHFEEREGEVYILTRGTKPLQLKPPKDPTADPRAIVFMKQGGIADGEAMGSNTTIEYFAWRLSRYLQLPVLNRTEIAGAYDFDLPVDDPENQDVVAATFSVVDRLGLKLKRGRGPVRTLVVDHIEQPTEN
jgi:uncharacterized protein (TIGR03435 family)